LSADSSAQKPLQLSGVLSWDTFKSGNEELFIIKDGDVVSIHHKDGKYAGVRAFLGKDGVPAYFIQDTGYPYIRISKRSVSSSLG
jgi:hypothetical protein